MTVRFPDFLVRNVFHPLWDRYEGSVRLRNLRALRRSQFDSPDAIHARQGQELAVMVRHAAATSPFYRERFASAGIDPLQVGAIGDLAALPLLTKTDIRSRTDEILSDEFRKEDLVPAKTGGSTGVALQVYCDPRCREIRNAAALRSDEWSGWRLGQPMGAVWGNPPIPVTFKNKVRAWLRDRVIYLDTMQVNPRTMDAFLDDWDRLRPGLLFGHAHSLFILAEHLVARGRRISPSGVVATSMMLLEAERTVMEQAFGIKVTNRYGCEEVSLIACECEQHRGLHLNADHNIVEFLRDDGNPCSPGEDGRIVVTELINFGMPMIRYEVGDRGVPADRICPCGRGLPMMETVTGRTADFLVAENGDRVAGISIIENSLTRIPGIRQMQLVQDVPCRVQVNLVPGPGYGDEVEAELISALRKMLGVGFSVQVKRVDAIPPEKSGKYRFSICRL